MAKTELSRTEKIAVIAKYLSVSEETVKSHMAKGDLASFFDSRSSEVELLRNEAPRYIKQTRRDTEGA